MKQGQTRSQRSTSIHQGKSKFFKHDKVYDSKQLCFITICRQKLRQYSYYNAHEVQVQKSQQNLSNRYFEYFDALKGVQKPMKENIENVIQTSKSLIMTGHVDKVYDRLEKYYSKQKDQAIISQYDKEKSVEAIFTSSTLTACNLNTEKRKLNEQKRFLVKMILRKLIEEFDDLPMSSACGHETCSMLFKISGIKRKIRIEQNRIKLINEKFLRLEDQSTEMLSQIARFDQELFDNTSRQYEQQHSFLYEAKKENIKLNEIYFSQVKLLEELLLRQA